MLHAFDISVDGVFVDIKEFEEAGQRLVAVDDGTSNTHALFGESCAAVFDMGNEALGVKFLKHVSDTGLGDLKALGDVDGAGVAFFLDQVEDLLEVVIAGGGAASAVTGAGGVGHGLREKIQVARVKTQEIK